jgi:hypothetical protein
MMMVEFCLVFIGFIALTTDFINYGIKHLFLKLLFAVTL